MQSAPGLVWFSEWCRNGLEIKIYRVDWDGEFTFFPRRHAAVFCDYREL